MSHFSMECREQTSAVVDMFNEQFHIKRKLFIGLNFSVVTHNMSVAENIKQNSDIALQYCCYKICICNTIYLIKMHILPDILVMS